MWLSLRVLRAPSPPTAPPPKAPSPPPVILAVLKAQITLKTDSAYRNPSALLSTAKTTLTNLVVAVSWARCLEAVGSAAPRPRRTAGGGAPLASSPREPLFSPPWTPSQLHGVHPPDLTHASAQLRVRRSPWTPPPRPSPPIPPAVEAGGAQGFITPHTYDVVTRCHHQHFLFLL
ncbi:atherin-like isoform X1 [Homarus americanus]|uniref:atherin-like isoform X1 n=1 Tax=Homarus americanus TaxID=6706 RepID=UPI001C494578|nr:atherin-like isoform X1 [Homarus americanus]